MDQIRLVDFLRLEPTAVVNKVICFPTDTVYGIGARIGDNEAIDRIFTAKKRDSNKPLAILCPNIESIKPFVRNVTSSAGMLMQKHWPGSLTLIFEKKNISDEITKGARTVAFRMPNSAIALAILEKFGLMAVTSVNISGEKEINSTDEIIQKFQGYIDFLITDTADFSAIPSTVVDVSGDSIRVLRQGDIKID